MKTRLLVPCALALCAAATTAHAQGVDELGTYGGLEDCYRVPVPQRLAIELRFGPYKPRVDDEVSGSPYEDTFGTDTRWAGGFEIDWQALRLNKVLSFGPGLAASYTQSGANARLAAGGEAAQETHLRIFPLYAAAVLRIDALADNTPIPVVPYVKGGLGLAFWEASEGEGTEVDDASYGYMFAAGAMLRLDWLDPDDAHTARANTGLDHSYLFAEYHSSRLDGFGSGNTMDVGTESWVLGLAVEMFF